MCDLFFNNAWRDAVGHNNLFNNDNEKDSTRRIIKDDIRVIIEDDFLSNYILEEINQEKHISYIKDLQTKINNEIKGNISFKISHSQKLLNMLLKYYWCSGEMNNWRTTTPPQCPIDSIILKETQSPNTIPWTKVDKIETYQEHINQICKTWTINEAELATKELEKWNKHNKEEIDKLRGHYQDNLK